MNDESSKADTEPTPFAIRQELVELVSKDLLGPFDGEDEEVQETSVTDRYVLGIIAPKNLIVRRETEDEFSEGTGGSLDEGSTEPSTSQAETTMPSSMGLTFTVEGTVNTVLVTASWGRYERAKPSRGHFAVQGRAAYSEDAARVLDREE
jgi:hypothetical protein